MKMKRRTNQIIMGSTLGLAAIAVAIDHTRHPLPSPIERPQASGGEIDDSAPCGLGSPDSLDTTPCALGTPGPCSLTPCSLSPCSLGREGKVD